MGKAYWNYYYYEPAEPKEVKDGIKAKSKKGAIGETWWSKRWIGVLESFDMGARLGRGRSYARRGQVISIDVQKGVVLSKVQGTRSKPYDIKIQLKPISEDDWEKVTDEMASKAIFAAKLLSSQMPTNIEDAFSKVKISYSLAVLGGKIDVNTLDGTGKLKIPAGTQNNDVFRLKGKGVPHFQSHGRGDQLVEVVVDVPVKLDKSQKKIIDELGGVGL